MIGIKVIYPLSSWGKCPYQEHMESNNKQYSVLQGCLFIFQIPWIFQFIACPDYIVVGLSLGILCFVFVQSMVLPHSIKINHCDYRIGAWDCLVNLYQHPKYLILFSFSCTNWEEIDLHVFVDLRCLSANIVKDKFEKNTTLKARDISSTRFYRHAKFQGPQHPQVERVSKDMKEFCWTHIYMLREGCMTKIWACDHEISVQWTRLLKLRGCILISFTCWRF